jgi:hypothetical protein
MSDLHPTLAVMMQCIQPQVFSLNPSGILRHIVWDGRSKVFDRTQVATAELVRVLPGRLLAIAGPRARKSHQQSS